MTICQNIVKQLVIALKCLHNSSFLWYENEKEVNRKEEVDVVSKPKINKELRMATTKED